MLAYNVLLCGVDLSSVTMLCGYRETSIVFAPKQVVLPELTYDQGELDKLRPFLPMGFTENADAWF